jgi:YesN/AraC family two-component response regulator
MYIKKNGISAKTVMITGYQEMDESFMKAIGVDEYLTKPVSMVDIDTILKKYSKPSGRY